LLALAAALVGCGGASTVTLDLEVPQMAAWNPLDKSETGRLAWFRLRRDADGSAVAQARFAADQAVQAGPLPAGPPTDFDLDALADSGQILALGRLRQVAVSADHDTRLTVHFRKPIGYLTGGPEVLLRDATKAARAVADPGTLPGLAGAGAVSVTHDGTAVLFAVGQNVVAYSTATHMAMGPMLPLPEPAAGLVVDPTDRTLAVLGATKVIVFSLAGWLSGSQPEPMGAPANVPGALSATFSADGKQLFVVTSAPALYQLDPAGAVAGMASLPERAADIAVFRTGSAPILALPARGQLAPVDVTTGTIGAMMAPLPRASVVVATDTALVGFGDGDNRADSGCPAGSSSQPLAVVVVSGQEPRKVTISIPPFTGGFSQQGGPNQLSANITTAKISIRRAAATPDGARAFVWATAEYCGSPQFFQQAVTCSSSIQAVDEFVMLVDLSSGTVVAYESTQEALPSGCSLDCCIGGPPPLGICTTLTCHSGTRVPPMQFAPKGLTMLFGGK